MKRGGIISLILGILGVLLVISFSSSLVEEVEQDEILAVRGRFRGKIKVYNTAGIKWQGLGKVYHIPKRDIYHFAKPIRFNDGAKGTMYGSIQYLYPTASESMIEKIISNFGDAAALKTQHVAVATEKSIYVTGPLLSSKESYAEKRSAMLYWIEDQVLNGNYETTQEEIVVEDELSGAEKTVTVAEIVTDDNGQPARVQKGQFNIYGLEPQNFTIDSLIYDERVQQQIQTQQENIMEVQTALAEAKAAQQRAITVEEQGKANAAQARWEREKEKAIAVVAARQALEVDSLGEIQAGYYKQQEILKGQGEAERKRLVLAADGALKQKLEAVVQMNKDWADAFANSENPLVPTLQMGASSSTSSNSGGTISEFQSMVNGVLATNLANMVGVDIRDVRGKAQTK